MSEPLVTLDRFAQLRPDAPGFDAGSATGVAAARAALASASDEVEKHLRRSLLARAADLDDVMWTPAPGGLYVARLKAWPFVQWIGAAPQVACRFAQAKPAVQLVRAMASRDPWSWSDAPTAVVGYRRGGDDVKAVQAYCPEATILPDELPSVIESVVCTLAIAELYEGGRTPSKSQKIAMGSGVIESESMERGHRDAQLARLDAYRRTL